MLFVVSYSIHNLMNFNMLKSNIIFMNNSTLFQKIMPFTMRLFSIYLYFLILGQFPPIFWIDFEIWRSFSKTYIHISSPIKNSLKKNRRRIYDEMGPLNVHMSGPMTWIFTFFGREKGVGCWGKLSSFTYLNCSSLLQHQANWTLC